MLLISDNVIALVSGYLLACINSKYLAAHWSVSLLEVINDSEGCELYCHVSLYSPR